MKPIFLTMTGLLAASAIAMSVGCDRGSERSLRGKQQGDADSRSTEPAAPPEKGALMPVSEAEPVQEQASISVAEPQEPSVQVLDFAALRTAGQEALQAGDIDAAFDYARWAMRLDAKDPQVIFLMASVLAERNRFPEAIAMLDEVAKTTPQARLPAMGQTADWLVRFGNWSEAESRYQTILQSVPDFVLAHRSLARLLIRQGRRLEALPHLNRLCQLGDIGTNELTSMLSIAFPLIPNDEASLESVDVLGKSRDDVSLGQWTAIKIRFQEQAPAGPWESALQGRVYAVLDDFESLGKWLQDADSSANISSDAWFAKGANAFFLGDHSDAARCFGEAVLLDPTDPVIYQKLAASLTELKLPNDAERVRQRAALIEATHTLGRQLVSDGGFDRQQVLDLCERLTQLKRPWEALAWQSVWLAEAGTDLSDVERQSMRDQLSQERDRLLAETQAEVTARFLLCELDLDALAKD